MITLTKFVALALGICISVPCAQSQTWNGGTGSDWNTATNWSPAAIPNSGSAIATFDVAGVLGISLSADTEVRGVVFTASAASPYTITISPTLTLTVDDLGIVNNSGAVQGFSTTVDANGNHGTIQLTAGASVSANVQLTNNAGIVSGSLGGQSLFQSTSSAGSSVILNWGASVNGAGGGTTIFQDTASAGNATITTSGGTNGGGGGATYFVGHADGGTAQAMTTGNGVFDVSGLTSGGMNVGSIAGSGTYYLGGNTLTTGGDNISTTVSGVIADGGSSGGTGGSLVLTGTGALILSGANTYTGTTSIINGATLQANVTGALPAPVSDGSAGTVRTAVSMDQTGTGGSNLVLGASQAVASLTGATLSQVNLNANTLTIGSSNSATSAEFDGIISDAGLGGSLIKDGASKQILAGANTYVGSTTVTAGTLVVDGSLAAGSSVFVQNGAILAGSGKIGGTVNILSGGTLQPGDQTPDTLTMGNLVLNAGSNVNFRLQQSTIPGSQINDLVSVTNSLTIGGTLNVTAKPGFGIGVYPLFTYGGTLMNNGFSAINGLAGYTTSISAATLGEVDLVVSLGTPQYWDGIGTANDGLVAGGNGIWNTTTRNWTTAAGTANSTWQGGTAIFGASTAGTATVTISGAVSVQGVIFDATGYTLSIGTLSLAGARPAISVTHQADSATISAKITGATGLNATGAGSLILTNSANSYTGGTNISTGTLEIGTSATAGSIGGGTISVSNGGLLLVISTMGNVLSNNLTNGVAANGTLNVDSAQTTTLTGTLTDGAAGQFSLTQSGPGTAILSNAGNSYRGTTTVVIGSLQIGTTSAAGSIGAASAVSVSDNGTLTLVNVAGNMFQNRITNGLGGSGLVTVNSAQTTTLSGVLSDGLGTLSFTQSGSGTTILSGDSNISGATTVSAGTLQVGNGSSGSLSGGGGISISGSGKLILDMADGRTFGQAVNLATTTATLRAIQSGTTTLGGVISGTGGVTQSGTGTTILSAMNKYTGPTTVSAGVLEVDGSLAVGSAVSIGPAGTLTGNGIINGKVTLTGNGAIDLGSGGEIVGTVSVSGGTWAGLGTVLGAVTVSGTGSPSLTIASGETLTANSGVALTAGVLAGNGTLLGSLTDTSSANFSYGGVIGGTGALTMNNATGTLTLTNTNTYSGATTVSAGTLQVGNGISGAINNSSAVTVSGSGKLVLNMANGGSVGQPVNLSALTATLQAIQAGTTTLSGVIGGTGGVTQSGSGTTILSAVNTYTGPTTISAGTLEVDGKLAAGSTVSVGPGGTLTGNGIINGKVTLAGNGAINLSSGGQIVGTLSVSSGTWAGLGTVLGVVTVSGTASPSLTIAGGEMLTANSGVALTAGVLAGSGTLLASLTDTSSANFTFGGVIAGNGALTMNNATGALTLTNTNTYSGATTVSAGTLQVGNGISGAISNSSAVTVGGSGKLILDMANGGSIGEPVNLIATTATLQAIQAGTTTLSGVISGTGGVTQGGSGTTILSAVNTYTGPTTISGGTLEVDGKLAAGSTVSVGPGGTLTGNGIINGKVTLAGNGVINLGSGGEIVGTVSVSGGTWAGLGTVLGVVTVSGTGSPSLTIAGGEMLTANSGVALTAGVLAGNGTLLGSLTDTSSANFSYGGVIAGNGALTMNNLTGALTLTNTNTYSGATTVSAGTLQVGNGISGAISNSSAVTVNGSGKLVLDLVDGASFAQAVNLNALTATLQAIQGGTTMVSGLISGTGGVTQNGTGTTILSAVNTYTGPTTISGGTLKVDGKLASGSVVSIGAGGTLAGNGSINGKVTLAGNGAIDLGGSGQIAGTVSVSGGTWAGLGTVLGVVTVSGTGSPSLTIAGGEMLTATSGVALTAGVLAGSGTLLASLTDTSSANFTFGGVIAGNGALTMNNLTGALTLTNTNTYSGATTVSAGTLQVGNGISGAISNSSAVTVGASGKLILDLADGASFGQAVNLSALTATLKAIQGGTTTVTGVISGTGGVTQSGTGTTILSAVNTYTGPTTISAGTLEVDGKLAAGSTVSVGPGGTLTGNGIINGKVTLAGNGAINLSSGGQIVGTVSVSSGTWAGLGTVLGVVTVSGTGSPSLTIAGGEMLTANSGVALTAGVLAGSGTLLGSLTDTSSANFTYGGVIAGNGALTMNNLTGALTLTNTNTYSGATTVSAGTLQVGNGISGAISNSSAVTVGASGKLILDLADGASFGQAVNLSALTATLKAIQGGTTTLSGVISGTGGVTQSGTGTTILSAVNTYTGPTTISAGTLEVDGKLAAGSTVSVGPGGTLTGNGIINGKVTLAGNGVINLGSGGQIAGTVSVSSGTWAGLGTVLAVVTVSGTGSPSLTIAGGEMLTANSGVALTAGVLAGSGTLLGSLTDTSTANFSYGGVIAGNGGLTMNNATGALTLTNTNTYSGATTVSAGTLQVGNGISGAISNSSAVTVNGSGKLILDMADGASFGQAVNLSALTATLKAIQGGTTTLSGVISGTGGVTQSGTGTTILSAVNTYTGPTTISAGTLEVDGSLATGSAVSVGPGGTLTGNGIINGKVTLAGNGVINLSSGGEIVGTVSVSSGTWAGLGTVLGVVTVSGTGSPSLTIAGGEMLTANSGVALTAGVLAGSGTLLGSLTDTSTANFSYGGVIAGSGGLTMNSVLGTLVLTNTNTYSGATTVSAGTLQVGNGMSGAIGNGSAVTVSGLGKLALNLADGSTFSNAVTDSGQIIAASATNNYTIAGQISGTGALVKNGNGTVTLTGNNTYKGGTMINGGALLVNNTAGTATGSGAVTVGKGATLGGSGTISGAVTLNSGGVLEPGMGAPGIAGTVLHENSMLWNGGATLTLQIGTVADELVLSGPLTKGSAGPFTIDILDANISPGTYTLVTFSATTFAPSNFTLQLPQNYTGTLVETTTSLMVANLMATPGVSELPSMAMATSDILVATPAPAGFRDDETVAAKISEAPGGISGSNFDGSTLENSASPEFGIVAAPEPNLMILLSFGAGILLHGRRRRSSDPRKPARP